MHLDSFLFLTIFHISTGRRDSFIFIKASPSVQSYISFSVCHFDSFRRALSDSSQRYNSRYILRLSHSRWFLIHHSDLMSIIKTRLCPPSWSHSSFSFIHESTTRFLIHPRSRDATEAYATARTWWLHGSVLLPSARTGAARLGVPLEY